MGRRNLVNQKEDSYYAAKMANKPDAGLFQCDVLSFN